MPTRPPVGFFRGLHKCQSVQDASSFFASGDPSDVVPHRWRRPCHRSCVRWYGIGLVIVAVMANGPGLVFFILVALSAATAMHLRP